MKVALVKQVLDVFGPWSSVLWNDTDPRRLFDVWPSKAFLWETTCLLEADWYIIPQRIVTGYAREAVFQHPGREEIIKKHTKNVFLPTEIPFEQYDLVITFDPILDVPAPSRTLFAYYCQEHWDEPYRESLREPIGNYDLFLAHMMDSKPKLTRLPQAISFPYLRAPDVVRSVFPVEKQEVVWIDWRTFMTLSFAEFSDPWNEGCEQAAERLQQVLPLPIQYRGKLYENTYGVSDPPMWGDAAHYLEAVGSCKYYVAVGRIAGAGQGLGDAASLGCICIGQQDKAYHRMICHPSCLCADMTDMPAKVRKVAFSRDLQQEVLAWQDEALRKKFVEEPLALLKEALHMKCQDRVVADKAFGLESGLRRRRSWWQRAAG